MFTDGYYRLYELAKSWGMPRKDLEALFVDEPGVQYIPGIRESMRIPESVAQRVYGYLMIGRSRPPLKKFQGFSLKRNSKIEDLLMLIGRPEGATDREIASATGWSLRSVKQHISRDLRRMSNLAIGRFQAESGERRYRLLEGSGECCKSGVEVPEHRLDELEG